MILTGEKRAVAARQIIEGHYSHCVPSGKSHYIRVEDGYFVFAIPANKNIGPFLLGNDRPVWELARMWAPDNHIITLTAGLAQAITAFRIQEPTVVALVSYADPNQGHEGGVYRAASWLYTGQSAENRCYLAPDGQVVARRKFHSGSRSLRKVEIEALGYRQVTLPGKHRFAKGLTATSRRILAQRFPR